MIFSSRIFLFIFLPLALLGYFILPRKFRNLFLLLASFGFYAWAGPKLLIVLLACITLNYLSGLLISTLQNRDSKYSSPVVTISVLFNLLLLGYFKYFNFFIDTTNHLGGLEISQKDIILPLGISFFTFSGISYLLDLNFKRIKVEKNPVSLALYISFFPKLLQGPISRFSDFSKQIANRETSIDKIASGAYRFVIGLAKKVIIADQLGIVVDHIFTVPVLNNSIPVAWVGAIGYSFQIFFDFSGYTDMAIGLGKMMGFDITENFNFPYLSTSITEFWRRWHITLSSWFRDYVFTTLEIKRRKTKVLRQETNLLITFLLTGLWHGAAWNFVLWGTWHGIFIIIENLFKRLKVRIKVPVAVKWLVTTVALILGWVLFRSPNISYAFKYIGVMFGTPNTATTSLDLSWYLNLKVILILTVATLACIPWVKLLPKAVSQMDGSVPGILLKNAFFAILLAISITFVISSSTDSFLYFKF